MMTSLRKVYRPYMQLISKRDSKNWIILTGHMVRMNNGEINAMRKATLTMEGLRQAI